MLFKFREKKREPKLSVTQLFYASSFDRLFFLSLSSAYSRVFADSSQMMALVRGQFRFFLPSLLLLVHSISQSVRSLPRCSSSHILLPAQTVERRKNHLHLRRSFFFFSFFIFIFVHVCMCMHACVSTFLSFSLSLSPAS